MTPWVLRILLANGIVFLLQMVMPGMIENLLAFVPAQVLTRPWTVVTYMFVHGGFGHILFNMLTLFFFGIRTWLGADNLPPPPKDPHDDHGHGQGHGHGHGHH